MIKKIEIANIIKYYWTEIGLTKEELAVKAQIPYTILVKIESGQVKNPMIKTLKKIATALDITVDNLLN